MTPGSPTREEEEQAAEQAKLANPQGVAAREESRTKFEGLSSNQAAELASEVFPTLIDRPAGGPPQLPAEASITGYLSDAAAQVDLGGGKHALIESLTPIAVEPSPGKRVPIDMGLSDHGTSFQPATPAVEVSLPKRLSDGISLSGLGVSLTPVDASGSSLHGSEGVVGGASVFYANTQSDADTVAKPTTGGFELDSLLRSVDSPQQLSFKVGLPSGASLVGSKDGRGPVAVVAEGAVIASVLAPTARDAAGNVVPVSMAVSGDTLTLTVDDRAHEYQYPIAVDPSVTDEQVTGKSKPTNWKFCVNFSETCAHEEGPFRSTGWGGEALVVQARSHYEPTETAAFVYQSQGESHIYFFSTNDSGENAGANIESVAQIASKSEIEASVLLSVSSNYGEKGLAGIFMCPHENCTATGGTAHNVARFQQTATGGGEHFSDTMWTAEVQVAQSNGPEQPKFNTSEEHLSKDANRLNVMWGSGAWLSPTQGAFEVTAKDPGVGISYLNVNGGGLNLLREYYEEGKCSGVNCAPEVREAIPYESKMVDGEYAINVYDKDLAAGWGPSIEGKVKVDGTGPQGLVLTGLPGSGVMNEAQYHLQTVATDGSGKTLSSGVKAVSLYIDGFEVPGKTGTCKPGPCSAVGEWTINGEAFGAGKHEVAVQAIDNAGNIETKKSTITVRHAASLRAGPGAVDPITGAFHLGASDVSIASSGGNLGVSRSYNSRQLKAGEAGPFGPQWSLSISGSQSLEREPTGSVLLIAPDGSLTTFEGDGKGGFISPKGDENLVLSAEKEGETIKAYLLKNPAAGTTVRYTQPGGTGPWVIASSEGALSKGSGEKVTFEWERIEGLTRPKQALAPVPAGVTCSPTVKEPKELSNGCRALTFVYATKTAATGEAPSEWNEYNGRLKKVVFTAYNPATKAMEEKPVAEYAYDKQGRLRAEWDPRISPTLKSTYGYDAEGHVVAVNPPGQQPSLLRYGTTASDATPGRLLSVTRPPTTKHSTSTEETELKEADERPTPVNTGLPTLSTTTPVIGTTLSIASNGSWTNSPLTYSDSWEDCGETCTPIPGAVNSTYTPQPRDAGYTLKAQVTAVNSDGAAVGTTTATSALALPAPGFLRTFGSLGEGTGQLKGPGGAAADASGNIWVVDRGNNRISEWSGTGTFLKTCGAKGEGNLQFKEPQGIAINQGTGNVYVADKGNNRIEELNASGEFVRVFGKKGAGSGELNAPEGIAVAPNGSVWVGDYGNNRVAEFSETGEAQGSFGTEGTGNGQFKGPDGIAFSGGNGYVVDVNNSRVQEFSPSGEYVRKFGTAGSGTGQFTTPHGITTDPLSGDLWVSDYGNNRMEEFNPAGAFLVTFGKKGTGNGEFTSPEQLVVNTTGDVYVSDTGANRVQELEPNYSTNNPAPEPPVLGKSAVSTIEYNVPLSGTGLNTMTKGEVENWGQTDDPIEATAVFPPDEPMGWPAKDYKRATLTYLDALGRTVNTVSPTGGVATIEYNEYNGVIRSLSADSRAAALKEANPKVASELLDTKSKYNGETKAEIEAEEKEGGSEPGARLLETRGPQHIVKLSTGVEVKARHHIKYYYDAGAPEGETYNLVTATEDSAEYEGKEADKRSSESSYSGQENLGWQLRKPTSVATTTHVNNLSSTTVYDPKTGNVLEQRSPLAESAGSYLSQFGSAGTGNGQFFYPHDLAIDKSGNIWVADTDNNRVQEFSSTGEFIKAFGTTGTGHGQFNHPEGLSIDPSESNVWVADTGNSRIQEFNSKGEFIQTWGSLGSGNGQFKSPEDVVRKTNGSVLVLDTYNNRIQELTYAGVFVKAFGSEGSGNGQFKRPEGMALDSAGNMWIADTLNNRVQELSSTGTYLQQFGTYGSGKGQLESPGSVTLDGSGHVFVGDTNRNRIEEFSVSGAYIARLGSQGTSPGQFELTGGVAADASGHLWATDLAGKRVQEFSTTSSYLSQFGTLGSGNGQLKFPEGAAFDASGNMWVADTQNNRIDEFSSTGGFVKTFGSAGTTTGKFESPAALAIDSGGHIWVADTLNNRVQEFSSSGEFLRTFGTEGSTNGKFIRPMGIAVDSTGNVWVVDTYNNRVQEFSSEGTFIKAFGIKGTGNGEFQTPEGIAIDPSGDIWVSDTGNGYLQEFTAKFEFIKKLGSKGTGNGQFEAPDGMSFDTAGNIWVADPTSGRIQEFLASVFKSYKYAAQYGSVGAGNGQMRSARDVLAHGGILWVVDTSNSRIQQLAVPVTGSPHAKQTVYYTAAVNKEFPACGSHPEWANLPCRAQPGAQPAQGPPLPVSTETYNMWDEPETMTEEFGTTTRTRTLTYDAAGRPMTSEQASSNDTPLPKVTNEYNGATGALEKESTTKESKTQTVTTELNTLGQLASYTDADGKTSTDSYDIDGRPAETGYEIGTEKYSQMASYDPTTGMLTQLFDTAAKSFTASYDVEGKMTSETYPNAMVAKYTRNAAGETTGVAYEKTAHCKTTCPETWFSETVVPAIHGEAALRTSNLAKTAYAYDKSANLTEVQETPAGKGCTTRLYAYDEDTNRMSLTTREPGTEGKCATTGGTLQAHTYDETDRPADVGISYEAFGNTAKVPAADAGESELTSTYYVDSQTATQKQGEETISYAYDPTGRPRETVSEGPTKGTVIDHYSGPGEALSWASEGGEEWTRHIPGIDGSLGAIESSSGATVLELHDLQGNVVAEAAASETETKLLKSYSSTEFGVPANGTPPKYSWLGAMGQATELPSGATTSGGNGYVPQLGRALQTQAIVPPGAFPSGSYSGGPYTTTLEPWVSQSIGTWGSGGPTREAARQAERAKEAEEALMRCAEDGSCVTVEDPDPWVIYPNQEESEAISIAAQSGNIVLAVTDLTGFVKDALESITGAVAKYLIGQAVFGPAEDWLKAAGRRLQRCVGAMWAGDGTPKQRGPTCRIEIFTSAIKIGPFGLVTATIPDFDREPEISYCKYGTTWCLRK